MQSFDRTPEFKNKIEPMMKELINACEELGMGIVIGVCFSAEHTGEHEGTFMLGGGASLTESNAACHLVAAHEIIGGEEGGHELAHIVLNHVMENMRVQQFIEENREEIAAKVREIFEKHNQARMN